VGRVGRPWLYGLAAVALIASPVAAMPSNTEIEQLLAQRIDTEHRGVGIVVGILSPDGRRVVVHGKRAANDPRPLNGDTQFEIGSITKAFVGLLLVDLVRTGNVRLDEPVNRLLPPSMALPREGGRSVTLLDLATHTAGLPEEPANLDPADVNNPYATYSPSQFAAFATSYRYPWLIGSKVQYSNLGYGLLGYGLGRAGGPDLAQTLQGRVLDPLGLHDTTFDLREPLKARLAPAHDADLHPFRTWDHSSLFQGSGGLHSSANDLLTFLSSALGLTDTSLAPDFQAMLAVRRKGPGGIDTAIGWTVLERDGQTLVFKGGGTGGYRSCVAFDQAQHTGVVVLANTGDPDDCDIAWHLLDPAYPLAGFSKPGVSH
jgi:D-alanyl-D-alanine-carboxypeptidase/D-alanyl-D-alanine-endopeptidase